MVAIRIFFPIGLSPLSIAINGKNRFKLYLQQRGDRQARPWGRVSVAATLGP
jgi:hypothetical protein